MSAACISSAVIGFLIPLGGVFGFFCVTSLGRENRLARSFGENAHPLP